MDTENFAKEWKVTKSPPTMTRSFEFDSYEELRPFLDDLADLSEKEGFYPNLNFNRSRVTVTVQNDEGELLGIRELDFAKKTDELFLQKAA